MRILAIETSCDETAIALVEAGGSLRAPRFKILKNIISSQVKVHRPWGGVVPNLAKREHAKNLPKIFRKVLGNSKSEIQNLKQAQNSKTQISKIDLLCVTIGPGLEPALWTGIEFAKQIHKQLKTYNKKLKLIGVNHLEGHLCSFLLDKKLTTYNKQPTTLFPAIALIASGGHTILLKMDSLTKWKRLGETRDDAVGEAFDKVAKMLGLAYPGGPEIEKLAKKGNPNAVKFPRPMIGSKDYNFSYSGLKTSVLYYLRDMPPSAADARQKKDIAASFQEAALDVLVKKTERAAYEFGAKSVFLSGGVAANKELRGKLSVLSKKLGISFLAPPMDFNTDNAVMIAVAGYINHLRKKNRKLVARGNLEM